MKEPFYYTEGAEIEMFIDGKWTRGKVVNGYRFRDGLITMETAEGRRVWCGEASGAWRIKDRAAPVFDSEQVRKGDLIRAKHKTWDEYKNGLVVGITSNELVVLYHTGIGNVSNHFVMLASEVAGGEWQGTWTEDMQAIQDIVPAENESGGVTA